MAPDRRQRYRQSSLDELHKPTHPGQEPSRRSPANREGQPRETAGNAAAASLSLGSDIDIKTLLLKMSKPLKWPRRRAGPRSPEVREKDVTGAG